MNSLKINSISNPEKVNRDYVLKEILSRSDNYGLSLDLLFDVLENLLLDCKSVSNCNSNRYINNFFLKYKQSLEEISQLRLSYTDFNVLKVIGQGAFGQVQLVRHRDTGHLYALKILNKSQMIAQEGSICWMFERDIMADINSRWIVNLEFAFQDSKCLYMAMEYLPGGNLLNWINQLENNPQECDVKFYAAEILLAIDELHRANFVHRDIKPDNILLDCSGHVKLTDFGSCVKIDSETGCVNCNRAVGTPDYISPEVLLSQSDNQSYGCEVDWWAYGVLLYEIFYGDPPFYTNNLALTYSKIMAYHKNLNFELDGEQIASDDAVDLMKNLICDRNKRLGREPHAQDLKAHCFFSNMDWSWDNIQNYPAPFIPTIESECDTSNFEQVDDEDIKRAQSSDNCKELTSKVFYGENLQFSGFSYSKLHKLFADSSHVHDNNNKQTTDQSEQHQPVVVNKFPVATQMSNEHDQQQIKQLQITNQGLKDQLDIILFEKLDLETQLDREVERVKSNEISTNKLQKSLSELMSQHSSCDQKINQIEEERHKLVAQISKLKSNNEDDQAKLLLEISKLKSEQSMLRNTEHTNHEQIHRMQQHLTTVEAERQKLQAHLDQMLAEQAKAQLKVDRTSSMNDQYPSDLQSSTTEREYNLLQQKFDQLNNTYNSLKSQLVSLQKDNDQLIIDKDQLIQLRNKQDKVLQSHSLMLDLKIQEYQKLTKSNDYMKKLIEEMKLSEHAVNNKMIKLLKKQVEDKSHYEKELDDQRNKLNSIINTRNQELLQWKNNCEEIRNEKENLNKELSAEKLKCSQLVIKINEILTGESSAANEMMIQENQRRGRIGKKDAKQNKELIKQNRKLQQIYEDLQRQSSHKESEMNNQIHDLLKEKERLELEVSRLNNDINHYENVLLVETRQNVRGNFNSEASLDSTSESASVNSNPHRIKCTSVNSPSATSTGTVVVGSDSPAGYKTNPQESVVIVTDVRLRSNSSPHDKPLTTLSASSGVSSPPGHSLVLRPPHKPQTPVKWKLPTSNLELSTVKRRKAKKMNWDKRFVDLDGDSSLCFYDMDMNLRLKLPLFSLIFVKSATNADAIHAKASDIPKIFSVAYDRYKIMLATSNKNYVNTRRSLCVSNLSLNTGTNDIKSNARNNSVSHDGLSDLQQQQQPQHLHHQQSLDITDRRVGNRKSSLGRLFPSMLLGNKYKQSASFLGANIKSSTPDLTLIDDVKAISTVGSNDACNLDDMIALRGHIFLPIYPSEYSSSRTSLSGGDAGITATPVNARKKSQTLQPNQMDVGGEVGQSVSMHSSMYQCCYCQQKVHGHDLAAHNEELSNVPTVTTVTPGARCKSTGLFQCPESVVQQLCRTSTEQDATRWVNMLNQIIASQSK